jgi:hypothetical protein
MLSGLLPAAAILGLHKPLLADLREDRSIAAEKTGQQLRTMVENYLRAMDVPAKYAAEMYAAPRGMIKWITNDEFESDFAGFIPELRTLVDRKCDFESKNAKDPKRIECEGKVQNDLALHAYGIFQKNN